MDETTALISVMGIMIPITGIIIGGIVLIFFFYYRQRERAKLHETLRALAATDGPRQDQLLAALVQSTTPPPDRDLRVAIVLFAATLGFLALAFLVGLMEQDEYTVIWPLVAIAVFTFVFAVGRFVLWRMARDRAEG